eukprot:757699-Hanusia_phi.AAC.8
MPCCSSFCSCWCEYTPLSCPPRLRHFSSASILSPASGYTTKHIWSRMKPSQGVFLEQSAPKYPSSHVHIPVTAPQIPCPEQSLAQEATSSPWALLCPSL